MSKHSSQSPTSAQLPTVPGLPPCIMQMATDGTWHVTTQLAADEQDVLVTAASNPEALCQRVCTTRSERNHDGAASVCENRPDLAGQLHARVRPWGSFLRRRGVERLGVHPA